MTYWWTPAFDIVERLLPIIGTVVSIILMWRRAGKKQVNGLAARVEKQEQELVDVHAALDKCEAACAAQVKEIDLLRQGQQRFSPPGDMPT